MNHVGTDHVWMGPGTDGRLSPSLPSSLVFLDALWLGLAPFALHHGVVASSGALGLTDVVVATVVIATALARVVAPKDRPWLSLLNAALGLWLIVAPFVFAVPAAASAMRIDHVVIGLLLVALGVTSARLTFGQRADERDTV